MMAAPADSHAAPPATPNPAPSLRAERRFIDIDKKLVIPRPFSCFRVFVARFGFLRYCRSANVKSELPALTATYCLPPTEYVIGPDWTWPPTVNFHSSAPVRALSA